MTQTPPTPPQNRPHQPNSAPPGPPQLPDRPGAGLAIAALVLGICSFIPVAGALTALLAIVFGIIVLVTPRPGNGLAAGGIVAGVLLAAVSHIVILPAIPLFGSSKLSRSRELARRSVCAANLNGVGKALGMWTNDPTRADQGYPELDSPIYGIETPKTAGGADDVQKLQGHYIQNLCLLVDDGLIGYKTFICPSAENEVAERTGRNNDHGFYVFKDASSGADPYWAIDYAYHWGTSQNPSKATSQSPWENADGDMAILADRNPGGETTISDEWAHGEDGVNVLSASGGVKWVNPEPDGAIVINNDNIYTEAESGAEDTFPGNLPDFDGDGTPDMAFDQVLCWPDD